jgi:hypothetical protein
LKKIDSIHGVQAICGLLLCSPIVPLNIAKEFNIEPLTEARLMLAGGRRVRAGVSLAYFKIVDREGVFQAVLNECFRAITRSCGS